MAELGWSSMVGVARARTAEYGVQVEQGLAGMTASSAGAADVDTDVEASRAAVWFWSCAAGVVLWSVSYLLRQPGVATVTLGFSPLGSFAVEGMVLALSWLGLILVACLAVLTGAAVVEDPSA